MKRVISDKEYLLAMKKLNLSIKRLSMISLIKVRK